MCTGFVLFTHQTFIGMNFDISDRPILLKRVGDSQLRVLQKDSGEFKPVFGFNRYGIFINLLMVEPNEDGKYRRGKDNLHIINLFETILGGNMNFGDLDKLLRDKKVVNVPGISVHSLVTLPDRQALVIEPGRRNVPLSAFNRNFLALTNFPLCDFSGKPDSAVSGPGAERYQACCRLLQLYQEEFNPDRGFEILAATAQPGGEFPTQLSMLFIPQEGKIHFCIRRRFGQRFTFSFDDFSITAPDGYKQPLGSRDVLLSALSH